MMNTNSTAEPKIYDLLKNILCENINKIVVVVVVLFGLIFYYKFLVQSQRERERDLLYCGSCTTVV